MDAASRDFVRARAAGRCEYCRLSQGHAPLIRFWLEHIVARQHGGTDDLGNLALSCPHCNRHKGPNLSAINPLSGSVVPLFHPRTQRWRDHFVLDDIRIRGLTPTGRATADLLRMNADDRLDIRAHLRACGELAGFGGG